MPNRRNSDPWTSFNSASRTVDSALNLVNSADKAVDALGIDTKTRSDLKKGALIGFGILGGVWLLNKIFS